MKDGRTAFNILKDRLFTGLVLALSFLTVLPLAVILWNIAYRGFLSLKWDVIAGTGMSGIMHSIVGTLIIVAIAAAIAVPVGILCGIYLSENRKSRFADAARVSIDVLQGVPSVVLGMVVSIWLVKTTRSFSAISGSVALAIMMLPVIIKNTEETLKLVPDSVKEAAYALGVPYHKLIWKVVLPAGLSGIVTGVLVGIARVAGETAPLILTSFGSDVLNMNIFTATETLPMTIYKNYSYLGEDSPVIWGASFILVLMVLVLNIIAKAVTSKWKVKY